VQAVFPRYRLAMPEIRKQAKNCMKKVLFLVKTPRRPRKTEWQGIRITGHDFIQHRAKSRQKRTQRRRVWYAVK